MFHSASKDTSWDSMSVPITDPTPEWKQKIDNLRKAHRESDDSAYDNSSSAKKKSRWN